MRNDQKLMPKHATLQRLPLTAAPFRRALAGVQPMSMRADKPHIWFYQRYWRVSLWNRRTKDLDLWTKANAYAQKLNHQIDRNKKVQHASLTF